MTLLPFTSTWNSLTLFLFLTYKSQRVLILLSGKTVMKKVVNSFLVLNLISLKTWKLMIRTQSAMKLSNFWNLFWFPELNGLMKSLVVKSLKLSLPSVNGYMPFLSITKNLKLSSLKRLSLLKNKLTFKSPSKNWQRPEKNSELLLKNSISWKKILKSN